MDLDYGYWSYDPDTGLGKIVVHDNLHGRGREVLITPPDAAVLAAHLIKFATS